MNKGANRGSSPLRDNLTLRGQSSPLRVNVTPGGKISPLGVKVKNWPLVVENSKFDSCK
jgi:hypothetical protein